MPGVHMRVSELRCQFSLLSLLATAELQNANLLTEALSPTISLLVLRLFFILVRATPQVLAWRAGIA
jgi:hypothetical protein